jgi:hypothetical protein
MKELPRATIQGSQRNFPFSTLSPISPKISKSIEAKNAIRGPYAS